MRELIAKYEPRGSTLSAAVENSIDQELLFRATMEVFWIASNGDWNLTLENLKKEIGKEVAFEYPKVDVYF